MLKCIAVFCYIYVRHKYGFSKTKLIDYLLCKMLYTRIFLCKTGQFMGYKSIFSPSAIAHLGCLATKCVMPIRDLCWQTSWLKVCCSCVNSCNLYEITWLVTAASPTTSFPEHCARLTLACFSSVVRAPTSALAPLVYWHHVSVDSDGR